MLPRLVPEILSKCAFCDGAAVAAGVGIGDSRSLMLLKLIYNICTKGPNVIVFEWQKSGQ